jgi:putative ABC transport system substrate-binding protein
MSIALQFVSVQSPEQLDNAFSTITKARAQALYVLQDHLFTRLRGSILKMAANARLPVLHADKYVVETGGLLSYGPDVDDLFRRAAGYVDRILKGAKPADLPIEQPSKFQLAINLRTAKQLGIGISESIIMRADEVIR